MAEEKKRKYFNRKQVIQFSIGLSISILLILLSFTTVYDIFELRLYDLRFQIRGTRPMNPVVATIDMDDATLAVEGRYQDWTRDKYARIVRWVHNLGAKLIGFDVYFMERSSRILKYEDLDGIDAKSIDELRTLFTNHDDEMIRAMREAGNVILGQYLNMNPEDNDPMERESLQYQENSFLDFPDAALYDVQPYTNIETVLPEFAEAALGVGIAMTEADIDGSVRHYPVVMLHEGRFFFSLGLIMFCQYIGVSVKDVDIVPGKYIDVPEGKLPDGTPVKVRIPVDENCKVLVNWAGDYWEKDFMHIPYIAFTTYIELRKKTFIASEVKTAFLEDPETVEDTDKLLARLSPKGIEPDADLVDVYNRLYNCFMLEQAMADGKVFAEEELPPEVWADYVELRANHAINNLFRSNPGIGIEEVRAALGDTAAPEIIAHGYAVIRHLYEKQEGITESNHPLLFYEPAIEGRVLTDADFKDKAFFYGLTAGGTWDLNPMPFNHRYPMLGLHANAFNMFLQQEFLHQVPDWANILLMVFVGLLIGIIVPKMKPIPGAVVIVFLLAGYAALAQYLFQAQGLWIDVFGPVLILVLGYMSITAYNFFSEEKEKKMIRGIFSRYVTKSVVDEIIKDPDRVKLGGERKICTVFFSDVAGFTTISESLTPEELVALLNEYLTAMTNIVLKYDGMIDKYEGDAIMAVFGTPVSLPDHAARACYVSLEMQEELAKLREKWKAEGKPQLEARIGLNTGPMIAGNMGAQDRLDYTVMGDSVNLGSRLEGANKQYGTFIMISEYTLEMVKDQVETRFLDSLRVKGKKLPVKVYEVLARKENGLPPDKKRAVELYNQGIEAYLARNWDDGIKIFDEAVAQYADPPSKVYLERCMQYKETPPPEDWDGVYIMTTK